MGRTLLIAVTLSFVMVGGWAANVVCYHPQANDGIDPLAPMKVVVAWR